MKAEIQRRQFIPLKNLKVNRYSFYKINQLVSAGKLGRVNRNYYEDMEYNGEINDFIKAYLMESWGTYAEHQELFFFIEKGFPGV